MKKVMGLTARQARFVEEYLVDLNATRAARRAGYSAKTADVAGSRLLGIVAVLKAIEAGQAKRAVKTGITQERVLAELELLAFSNLEHYVVDDNGRVQLTEGAPAGAMRALSSIKRKITTYGTGDEARTSCEVEIRLWDKPGPLKLAGKHVGLFTDRLELSGKDGETTFTLRLDAPKASE